MEIIIGDSFDYLKDESNEVFDVITGVPDMDEVNLCLEDYYKFVDDITTLIFQKAKGYIIFIQTDRRYKGTWIDKATMLINSATKNNMKLMFHKIVLKSNSLKVSLYRPGYMHYLCFSKNLKPGVTTRDVLDSSKSLYKNGTPLLAAEEAVKFIKSNSGYQHITDFFAGYGTIAYMCKKYDIPCVSIDLHNTFLEKKYNKKTLWTSYIDLKDFLEKKAQKQVE